MKKIGFIDLFIDEWHADNYPKWFREAPRAGEFGLGCAWEEKTLEGRRPEKTAADSGIRQWKSCAGRLHPGHAVHRYGKTTEVCLAMTSTFQNLIAAMIDFFATGKSIIPKEQTIGIAALLEKSVAMLHGSK